MKYFGIGLALGLVGVVWMFVWAFFYGFANLGEEEPLAGYSFFMTVGKVVAIGGPSTFWVILPIVHLVRRRRQSG